MLLLTSTSDELQLVTAEARDVDVHASYMDYNGTTVTPGRKNTAITTAATTVIVSSPGSSVQRNVKTLHIRNKDSDPATITVVHDDGTTPVELFSVVLQTGEELQYVDELGFLML
jgi:hypothetical protein